jgi:hypothetical protein
MDKQVFTEPYPLSVPVNAVDRPGHRMGARPEHHLLGKV